MLCSIMRLCACVNRSNVGIAHALSSLTSTSRDLCIVSPPLVDEWIVLCSWDTSFDCAEVHCSLPFLTRLHLSNLLGAPTWLHMYNYIPVSGDKIWSVSEV